MKDFIILAVFGIFICILGAINMTGNISTIHQYHRKRVTEENRKPFGMLVGIGTVIIGLSLIIFGTLNFISEHTQIALLSICGTVIMIASIVIGLGISFYAMIKYNKGIF